MTVNLDLAFRTSEIPRDRWGRPLIKPADGGKEIPYTRISTLAKALQDTTALTKWLQRQVAIGMGIRDDLAIKARAIRDNDKELNSVVEQAMNAAESSRAANLGTAIHAFTEQVDDGAAIDTFPLEYQSTLQAYKDTLAYQNIRVLGKESFVVVDELQAAGTFDRLLRLPSGHIVVGDIKTGKSDPEYPHSACIQVAVYAHGHIYNPEEGRVAKLADLGVSTDIGVLIHLPAGRGECTLHFLDLNWGWRMAQTAVQVRTELKTKPIAPYAPISPSEPVGF